MVITIGHPLCSSPRLIIIEERPMPPKRTLPKGIVIGEEQRSTRAEVGGKGKSQGEREKLITAKGDKISRKKYIFRGKNNY